MNTETYLNHPNFGLLYRVCLLGDNQGIFTTLYAQRLFFLVKMSAEGISFESISRSDARLLIEQRLRKLRLERSMDEYNILYPLYQQMF